MLSKKRIATGLAAVASLVLIGGSSLGANPASASGAGACIVTGGSVTITSGGGIQLQTAHNDTFSFVGLTIQCQASDSTANGNWQIRASGHSDNETCASGTGGGTIDGGTGPQGAVSSGTPFSFTRAGSHVHVTGGVIKTATHTYSFNAEFEFTPNNGECKGDLSQPTTDAGLTGAAAVSEL